MASEALSGIRSIEYAQRESAIMDLLRASGKLTVEEIAVQMPDLSWSQLFLAVDVPQNVQCTPRTPDRDRD